MILNQADLKKIEEKPSNEEAVSIQERTGAIMLWARKYQCDEETIVYFARYMVSGWFSDKREIVVFRKGKVQRKEWWEWREYGGEKMVPDTITDVGIVSADEWNADLYTISLMGDVSKYYARPAPGDEGTVVSVSYNKENLVRPGYGNGGFSMFVF